MLSQVSYHADTYKNVTGKTGYAFCNNHIEFTAFCIGNHFIESDAVVERCAADTFIGINFYERPIGVFCNEILIVFLLQFKWCGLSYIVGRNADVDSDSLIDVIVIIVGFFLGRNKLVGQSEVFDRGASTAPLVLATDNPLQPADFLNQPKTTNLNEP